MIVKCPYASFLTDTTNHNSCKTKHSLLRNLNICSYIYLKLCVLKMDAIVMHQSNYIHQQLLLPLINSIGGARQQLILHRSLQHLLLYMMNLAFF